MALSNDAPLTRALGDLCEMPAAALATMYEGSMIGENGSGYARALTAGDRFRGHAVEKCDNSAGSDGTKRVKFVSGIYALQVTLSGVGVTDVGRPVYASDDGTLTLVGAGTAAAYTYVGRVLRYVSSGVAIVEFHTEAVDEFGPNPNRIVKSTDYVTLVTDAGKIIYVGTDGKTVTLLATVAGYEVTIVNSGADGAAGIKVAFYEDDKSLGGCGLDATEDGGDYHNAKATARRGDYLRLVADGADGYSVVDRRGTWSWSSSSSSTSSSESSTSSSESSTSESSSSTSTSESSTSSSESSTSESSSSTSTSSSAAG